MINSNATTIEELKSDLKVLDLAHSALKSLLIKSPPENEETRSVIINVMQLLMVVICAKEMLLDKLKPTNPDIAH